MSLIVARIDQSNIVITSDTKLTYPYQELKRNQDLP